MDVDNTIERKNKLLGESWELAFKILGSLEEVRSRVP